HLAEFALDASLNRCSYPFFVFVPQAAAERILERRLESMGERVERPVELVSVLDSGKAAVARLRRADGRTEVIRAKFLFGCDAAASTARRAAGIDFETVPYHQDLVVLDTELDAIHHDALETIQMVFLERGLAFMYPFNRVPLVRVVATAPGAPDAIGPWPRP